MSRTFSPFRYSAGLLLVAGLLGGLSLPVLGQSAAPNTPELSEEQKAELWEAAGDPRLEPWQGDFMRSLAAPGAQGPAAHEAFGELPFAPHGSEGSLAADGAWEVFATLSGRSHPTAIYDPVRDRMIVFGGDDFSWPPRDDTWALSLAGTPAWSELTPSGTRPGGRYAHAAIYDPVRDRMVVFGGYCAGFISDETWALSLAGTPAWSELTPAGTRPSGRWGHTAIYDSERDRMVIFGGSGRNDTWALSLAELTWSEITPSGILPAERFHHTAIYDPVRDRMVIFSGVQDLSWPFTNDVWALSFTGAPSWSELTPSGTPPSERQGSWAIYDAVRDRMVIFGGSDAAWPPGAGNDTWALSLGGTPTWSRLSPSGTLPPERYEHRAIYDPVRDRMVVFGGYDLNDTWALSFAGTPAWSELTPSGTPPPGRSSHAAIYDPVRDRMVVFGGYDLNDTWALSFAVTPAWSELTPSGTPPPGRSHHTAVYDPVRDRMVIFGGTDSTSRRNDTWALSFGGTLAWRELAPPSGFRPPARAHHTAIYDPVRDRMVVFGGAGSGRLNDTWVLALAGAPIWSELSPSGTPPSERCRHAAIYDPVRDRMVVFGGGDSPYGPPYCNDTWALALGGTPAWSELAPSGARPSGRESHTAIFDPVRGRMVIFGGHDGSHAQYDTRGLTWAATAVPGTGTQPPLRLALRAACPNPASGPTLIRFDLPVAGPTRLAVYDVTGRLVRRLVEGQMPAGAQQAVWDGKDEGGRGVAPGVYFARLEAGGGSLTEKVVILR